METPQNHAKTLTDDTKYVVSKLIKDMTLALSQLNVVISTDNLDADYAKTLLGIIESNVANISTKIGVATQSKEDIEERYSKILEANIKIRLLERQIGESSKIDQTIQSLKLLDEKFKHWWRTDGFGLTSDFLFKQHGVEATLSANLYGDFYGLISSTPVSDKENKSLWIKSLVDQGYIIAGADEQEKGEVHLVDCEKNRELISKLIVDKFPSAFVVRTENFHRRDQGFILKEIKVMIRNLRDIDALPSPPNE